MSDIRLLEWRAENQPWPGERNPFGWDRAVAKLEALGGNLALRPASTNSQEPYRTDSGNYILDCDFGAIADPVVLEREIKLITGVEKADSGEVTIGPTVKLAYVDQSRDSLSAQKNVWQDVSGAADIRTTGKVEIPPRPHIGPLHSTRTTPQNPVGTSAR